jgi:hypothetical protein
MRPVKTLHQKTAICKLGMFVFGRPRMARSRQRGACGTTLVPINEVKQRPPRSVLGLVTISGLPQPPSPWMACLQAPHSIRTWHAEGKRSSDTIARTALSQRMHVLGQTWQAYPHGVLALMTMDVGGPVSNQTIDRSYHSHGTQPFLIEYLLHWLSWTKL